VVQKGLADLLENPVRGNMRVPEVNTELMQQAEEWLSRPGDTHAASPFEGPLGRTIGGRMLRYLERRWPGMARAVVQAVLRARSSLGSGAHEVEECRAAMAVVCVSGKMETSKGSKSKSNALEAKEIAGIASALFDMNAQEHEDSDNMTPPLTMAVVTPYSAQQDIVRGQLDV